MLTIELVSDGPNVFVEFAEPYRPTNPARVYTSGQAFSLFHKTRDLVAWKSGTGKESDLKFAARPGITLQWLLNNGYDAVSEEADWLKTGEWPE